jgi:ribulose-phosphate 3-epimerase
MSVNPGFGGQIYISSVTDKIKQLAKIKKQGRYQFMIEVDGGINETTVREAVLAGAEVLVAGNAIFAQTDPGAACRKLKTIASASMT